MAVDRPRQALDGLLARELQFGDRFVAEPDRLPLVGDVGGDATDRDDRPRLVK
jgi:hypothetical protein